MTTLRNLLETKFYNTITIMVLKTALLGCAIAVAAAAAPLPECKREGSGNLTAANIIAIDSKTASCDGSGQYASECADATRAAPAICASFSKYQITTPGEQAALIALMLYETGGFKYSIHHFPGPNPGQGTRNMQSGAFNLKYASSLLDAATVDKANASGPDAVLALVNSDDEKSFGSAAWFLTSQCSADIRSGLAAATPAGWSAYLTQCVGTTDTSDRDELWKAAVKVLGAGQR